MSSHEFDNAFCEHNSSSILCEFCGVTEFSHEAENIEELREKAKTDSKYRESPTDDSIGWGIIDGKQYVYGCSCNSMDRYEKWILAHREQITDYLVARAKKEANEANHVLQSVARLKPSAG
jgi:hypothetical protein